MSSSLPILFAYKKKSFHNNRLNYRIYTVHLLIVIGWLYYLAFKLETDLISERYTYYRH